MENNRKELRIQTNNINKTKKFGVLFEEMTEALFLHDFNGDIKKVNKKACESLGITSESLETMNISNFISDEIINSFQQELIKRIKEKQYRYEAHYFNSDQTFVPIEITSKPVKLGKKRMMLTSFRDISIRKYYESQLLESKKQAENNQDELMLIFNNSPSSIFLFDENMNILRVNEKAIKKFNISSSEIKNRKIGDLINCTKTDCNSVQCGSAQICDLCKLSNIFKETTTGKNFTKEEIQISIQEENSIVLKTVLVSTSFLKKNGHSVFLATLDDITKRKEMELELLAAKEKAEESEKLKSAFIKNLNHEIRTPLNGILGIVSLFSDDNCEFSSHEKKEFNKALNQSSDRLIKTISDLVQISKLDCGEVKIKKERFDLKNALDLFIKEQRLKFQNPEIKLSYQFDLGLENLIINTDKSKLFEVLENLINNAFKFTTKGFIKIKAQVYNEDLEISVEDSGIGIETKFHHLIFKPFWQVQKDINRHFEGSGLGLAVSQKIVNNLGGVLLMKSDIGSGSTFTIKIPKTINLISFPIGSTTKAVAKSVSLEGKTILICEDEISNYIYLKTVLLNKKCKVIHAVNGLEAVKLFKANTDIDMVLMDLKMPEMNGLEATIKIKEIRKDIPIIAQSAYVLNGEKKKAIEAGCIECLNKPINKTMLIYTIEKHLSKKD